MNMQFPGIAVYLLCGITSFACTVLLMSRYRKSRVSLLFWSGMAFFAFTATNLLLFLDLVVVEDIDLSLARNCLTLLGVVVLLYGLIHDHT